MERRFTEWKIYRKKSAPSLRIWAIIISGLCFTIGNITWSLCNEPRVFYIPLAVFLLLLIYEVHEPTKKKTVVQLYFIRYFIFLAAGNVVKQVLYNETIDQINDYIWGAIITLILIIALIKWAIHTHNSGKKSGRGSAKR